MALQAPSIATVGVRVLPQLAGFQTRLTTGLTDPLKVASIAAVAGTVAVAAGLTKIGTEATRSYIEVEGSLAKIVGLVGVAKDQVDAWGESLDELAISTAQGPAELADALFFVTSAGLRGETAMEALEASARAATAGLGSTKSVADAVTSAMNAYGPATLDAAEATDVLVATVREGKVEASQVAGSLGRVIPIAAELGVSFNNVGAAIAAMTRVGLSAEESTTALRGIFNAILKPGDQAQQTLRDFGLSAEGLRDMLGQGEGLLDVLLMLKDRFGDNDDALARVFPRVRGLVGVLSLVGENADVAEGIFDRMADTTGDLDDAFNAVADTGGFKVQQALVEMRTVLVDLGSQILPDFVLLLQEITPILREQIVPAIRVGVEWMGNLVVGISNIVEALLTMEDPAGTAVLAIGGVTAALTVLAAHPVVATIAAITAGIALIGSYARENTSEVALLTDEFIRMGDVSVDTLESIIGRIPEKDVQRLKDAGIAMAEIKELLGRGVFGTRQGQNEFTERLKGLGLSGVDAVELVNALEHLQNQWNDAYWAAQQYNEEQAKLDPAPVEDYIAVQQDATDEAAFWEKTATDANEEITNSWVDMDGVIQTARDSVDEFITAQLRAVDPALNLFNAAQALDEAKSKIDETKADPKATSADIDDATADAIQAQADYNAAVGRFVLDQEEALAAYDSLVADLGLSLDESAISIRESILRIVELEEIDFSTLGLELKNGILVGLDGLAIDLEEELVFQIQSGRQGAMAKLGILSPSRVFAEEVGKPIAQGIAVGIRSGGGEIEAALNDVTQAGYVGRTGKQDRFSQQIIVNNPKVEHVERDIQKASASAATLAMLDRGRV